MALTQTRIYPVLYALLFAVALPLLLALWAAVTAPLVPLPLPAPPWVGSLFLIAGLALMLAGAWALRVYGRGLPMNPFPPSSYVTRGVYRWMRHPVYVGFVLAVAGASLLFGSASGLWLVTPVVALGCVALVHGYERWDLERRFGARVEARVLLSLPPDRPERPDRWHRLSLYVLVLLPWTLAVWLLGSLGSPEGLLSSRLPFEEAWPASAGGWLLTASVWGAALVTPLLLRKQYDLRRFGQRGLMALALLTLFHLTIPIGVAPEIPAGGGWLAPLIRLDESLFGGIPTFPASAVVWSLVVASVWAPRSRSAAAVSSIWVVAVACGGLVTRQFGLVDVLGGGVAWLAIAQAGNIWETLRRAAELMANAWHEWRVGPLRFIDHGLFVGTGAAVTLLVLTSLAGPGLLTAVVLIFVGGLLGAALWAQQLEGSSRLSRPFGYFGGLLGVAVTVLLVGAATGATLRLAAALAVAFPIGHALGRLRCLVQGCCHGSPASRAVGIRYHHPQSRVTAYTGLGGRPLHPTPLYSILGDAVILLVTLRLWWAGASFGLIAGAYLILAGIERFVEESYRGEPQTPMVGGLRVYQWAAVGSVLLGIVMSSLRGGGVPGGLMPLDTAAVVAALCVGILYALAMGADLPRSNRKYARLGPPSG